jgi:hypothetical protein
MRVWLVQGLVVGTRDRRVCYRLNLFFSSFFFMSTHADSNFLTYILFLTAQNSALSITDSIRRGDGRVLVAIGTMTVCLILGCLGGRLI